jgi:hypothetical protein
LVRAERWMLVATVMSLRKCVLITSATYKLLKKESTRFIYSY